MVEYNRLCIRHHKNFILEYVWMQGILGPSHAESWRDRLYTYWGHLFNHSFEKHYALRTHVPGTGLRVGI